MSDEKSLSLENRILETAKSVFMEKGYSDTSMSEIAERVGINRPGLHYYFRTKDKMFHAVFGAIVQSLVPQFQDILCQKNLPFAERIGKVIDVYYQMLLQNPYLPLFVLREIHRDMNFMLAAFHNQRVLHFFEELKKELQAEMDSGRLRQVPLRIVFCTFYSALVFPFLSKNLLTQTMMQDHEDFEDLLTEWKPYIVRQMVSLLCPAE